MKSRIAIFEGYGRPASYGAPIFSNRNNLQPRPMGRYGSRPLPPVDGYGRPSYYVPAERGYGPVKKAGGRRPTIRKGYKVRRMKDTPAMKKAQRRFKKAAKVCSRKAHKRGARKGTFQTCMRRQLKKSRR